MRRYYVEGLPRGYGDLGRAIASARGLARMAKVAQAVLMSDGGALTQAAWVLPDGRVEGLLAGSAAVGGGADDAG